MSETRLNKVAVAVATLACITAAQAAPAAPAAASKDEQASFLRLARAAGQAGDCASAAGLYARIDAAGRAPPAMLVEYGDALLDCGRLDDAIGAFGRVPERTDARVGALLGLERAYLLLPDPAKALAYAEEAAAEAPKDERVMVARGVALDAAGRRGEAQASYRAALAIAPRSIAARNDLALSLALGGRYAEAVDIIDPMARSANAGRKVRQNAALIHGLKGDADAAKAFSAADLDPAAVQSNLKLFELARQDPK